MNIIDDDIVHGVSSNMKECEGIAKECDGMDNQVKQIECQGMCGLEYPCIARHMNDREGISDIFRNAIECQRISRHIKNLKDCEGRSRNIMGCKGISRNTKEWSGT